MACFRRTQLDDQVYVFYGSSVPFVVRPREKWRLREHSTRQSNKLLGPCFVYGIMDGDFVGEGSEECSVILE